MLQVLVEQERAAGGISTSISGPHRSSLKRRHSCGTFKPNQTGGPGLDLLADLDSTGESQESPRITLLHSVQKELTVNLGTSLGFGRARLEFPLVSASAPL
jgi:hypothetical protein